MSRKNIIQNSVPKSVSIIIFLFMILALSILFDSEHFLTAKPYGNNSKITQGQNENTTLELGKPIERQLAGGESHVYQISLDEGQFFHLIVEQKGIDVVVIFLDPDSQQIEQVDSPIGSKGSESLKLVAAKSGVHLVRVNALEKNAAAGRYEIKLIELRAGSSRDRYLIEAEKTVAAADQLFHQGTAESLQQAKQKYADAAQLWIKLGDEKQHVDCLIAMGVISNYQDEHQQAIEYYKQALPLAQAIADSLSISLILSNIGATYYSLYDNQKAIEYYNKALPIASALGKGEDEINMLNMIGMTFSRMGNKKEEINHYEKAYLLSQKLQYKWGEAYSCSNIGSYYFEQSDLDNAFEYFKKARDLYQQIGAKRSEANALHNLGFIYDIWQEKQQALEYFNEANRLCKLVGNRNGEANSINSIGWIYFDLGERQLALDNFQQALKIWQNINDRQRQSIAQNGIGRIYLDNGEYEKALTYFQQSLNIANDLNDKKNQASSLNNIGLVCYHQGKWQEAITYFQDALTLKKTVGDPTAECYSENCLGKAYLKANDIPRALDHFNRALSISQQIGDRRMQAISYYNLAQVESKRGNLKKSKQHIEMSLDMIEQLRTKINSRDLQASFSGVVNDYYKFYIELLMQMHQNQPAEGYDIEALNVSERARARSLLDNLAESVSQIHQGIDAQLLETEKTLRRQLNAMEQNRVQLIKDKKSPDEIVGIEKQIRAALAQYDALFSQIRQQYPGYAALMRPVPLNAKQIQQQVVDANTSLLEFSLGEKYSYLWLVTPTNVTSYELPAGQQIDSVAIRVYNLLTARNNQLEKESSREQVQRITKADRELTTALLDLSKMILNPVAKKLTGSRLLIISEGALQYVPFAILPVPDTLAIASTEMARPLVANYEIICLPSASLLPIIRQQVSKRNRAELGLAVLADPVFSADDSRVKPVHTIAESDSMSGNLPDETSNFAQQTFFRSLEETGIGSDRSGISRLPFSRMEANAILDLMPEERRLGAFDFQASYETATSPMLQQYQIIHFATHGLLNSQNPQFSGIILSLVDEQGNPKNGFMRLFDIYNLNISADLVVLSACQTALGKEVKGEGLIGLTRGFMYAGASRVVASLWKVDDEATAELMKRFYQFMLGGEKLPAAAALRKAQISTMNEKRWQAPYYWAGFVLQGDWK